MNRSILIFLLGLIFIFSLLTLHGDLMLMSYTSLFAVVNPLHAYTHFLTTCPWYPMPNTPLFYLLDGVFFIPIHFLLSIPNNCVDDLYTLPHVIFYYQKLIYVGFYIAFFYLVFKITQDRIKSWYVLSFSPLVFTSFIFGQFDIIPAFFLTVSLLFLQKNRIYLAFLFLIISAMLKNYALWSVPFYLIYFLNNFQLTYKKWGILTLIAGIYPIISALYLVFNGHVYHTHSLTFPENTWMLASNIPVGGDFKLLLFPFGYLLLLFIFYRFTKIDFQNVISFSLITLILFYFTSEIHPQWYVWIVSFLPFININKFREQILLLFEFFYFPWIAISFPNNLDYRLLNYYFTTDKLIEKQSNIFLTTAAFSGLDLNIIKNLLTLVVNICLLYFVFDIYFPKSSFKVKTTSLEKTVYLQYLFPIIYMCIILINIFVVQSS